MVKNRKSVREENNGDQLSEAIKDHPKCFWSTIKRLKQENLGVADLKVNVKVILSDGFLISEILNNQYPSVVTEVDLESIPKWARKYF